jgi:tetratricopeptide (TPR) repeat protein
VQRADCLARLKHPKEALSVLEACEEPLPEYGLVLLAGLLEHAGRKFEAEPIFDELAGRTHLQDSVARRVLVHLEKRDPTRAINLARRLPETPENRIQLSRILQHAGQADAALEVLDHARRADPKNAYVDKEWVMAQIDALSPEEQVDELELALATRDNPQLGERLVQAYRKVGRNQEARKMLLQQLTRDPENLYLKTNLALVQRELGEIDQALDLLEAVMDASPGNPISESTYFKTCKDHAKDDRAWQYVATRAQQDPSRRRLWGLGKKYLGKS